MRKFTLLLAAAAFSATVANAQGYTLNPEAGVAEDLQNITITFDEPTYYYENSRMPVAVLENTSTGVVYNCAEPDLNPRGTGTGTEYKLVFIAEDSEEADTEITAPGSYTLTLRGFYTQEEGEDPVDVPVITAEYTVEFPVEYALDPEPGIATDLQGISIVFPEGDVNFYENNRMAVAVLENLTTGTLYVCQDAMPNPRPTVDGQEYFLVFTDEDGEYVNKINLPGEYLLTVRGMYLGEDANEGKALPAIQAAYTVQYPAPYVLTPAPNTGEAVKNLQGITIDFTADKVGFYENNRVPVAVLENTTTGKNYYCWEADRNAMAETEGAFYTFNFVDEEEEAEDGIIPVVEAITEPGNYKLTIRAMYVTVDEDGEEVMEDLPVITVNYTIDYPYAYVLTPADGSTVADLQDITLVFTDEEVVVNFYENNRMPVAVLENVETGAEYLCYEPTRNTRTTEGAVEYILTFLDEDDEALPITQPGNYKLTIKGMYVGELEYPEVEGGDEDNVEALAEDEEGSETETTVDLPYIYANYTIAYPYPYLLEPANGAVVSKIESVTIDFYQNTNIAFTENNRMPVAVLANGLEGDDEVVYVCNEADMNPRAESEGRVYTLVFSDENDEVVAINEPGLWYLTIRGLIVLGENEDGEEVEVDTLPVINAVYYVDGEEEGSTKVEDLTSPDGLYNVYSISGVQVVKNGSVDALKSLGKGIYVINGKKVVL